MSIVEHEQIVESPVELDEAGRQLVRAAEIIRLRGRCRGVAEDKEGRVCIAGALLLAAGREIEWVDYGPNVGVIANFCPAAELPSYERLAESLGRQPWPWNDDPERTDEEVLTALERAAYGL